MNGFQKAIAVIEQEAAEHGGYPHEISLTLYSDAKTYAMYRPGEDFVEHQEQRAALVAWCENHGIAIVDEPVAAKWPADSADRAEKAARKRLKRPYRLGVDMSGGAYGRAAIGWFMVWLEGTTKTTKGEM